MPIIMGIAGIFLFLKLAELTQKYLVNSKLILYIADNTYSIMTNQFVGFMSVKAIFCWFYLHTQLCSDFSWYAYHHDIWYYYLPGGIGIWRLAYLFSGLAVPILIQFALNHFSAWLFRPLPTYTKKRRRARKV